jgi:hypothetical protein
LYFTEELSSPQQQQELLELEAEITAVQRQPHRCRRSWFEDKHDKRGKKASENIRKKEIVDEKARKRIEKLKKQKKSLEK